MNFIDVFGGFSHIFSQSELILVLNRCNLPPTFINKVFIACWIVIWRSSFNYYEMCFNHKTRSVKFNCSSVYGLSSLIINIFIYHVINVTLNNCTVSVWITTQWLLAYIYCRNNKTKTINITSTWVPTNIIMNNYISLIF